ncbi:MAG: alpha/beta hydrolase family protein [Chthoniobacterales bacterium]
MNNLRSKFLVALGALFCAGLLSLSAQAQDNLETYAIAPDGALLQWVVHYPAGEGPWPVALMIHGGGFHGGGPNEEDLEAAAVNMSNAGYLALSITYRLDDQKLPGQTSDGGVPQQTDDCKTAVRAARSRPDCNGKVVAVGGSNGGSHAAFLAVTGTPGDDQVDAAVCLSGAYDLSDWRPDPNIQSFKQNVQVYCRVPATEPPSPESLSIMQQASPAYQVITPNSPAPIFMVASAQDPITVNQLPDMVISLVAGGNVVTTYPVVSRYEQLLIPGELHQFAYWITPDATVRNAALDFLDAALKDEGPTPTPSATPTPTPTPTPTVTPTPTPTATPTPTPTATPTPTPTVTPTATPTPTVTPKPTATPPSDPPPTPTPPNNPDPVLP